jgi:hypothetical protein
MHLELMNCDLGRLSDLILEVFVGHPLSEKAMGLGNTLGRRLHTCFQNEQIRRLKARAGYKTTPIAVTIPIMDGQEILEAAVALSLDCVQLEDAAAKLQGSDLEIAVRRSAAGACSASKLKKLLRCWASGGNSCFELVLNLGCQCLGWQVQHQDRSGRCQVQRQGAVKSGRAGA